MRRHSLPWQMHAYLSVDEFSFWFGRARDGGSAHVDQNSNSKYFIYYYLNWFYGFSECVIAPIHSDRASTMDKIENHCCRNGSKWEHSLCRSIGNVSVTATECVAGLVIDIVINRVIFRQVEWFKRMVRFYGSVILLDLQKVFGA